MIHGTVARHLGRLADFAPDLAAPIGLEARTVPAAVVTEL